MFARTYGLKSIELRYFDVFGKRQDLHGAYATVIPRTVYINGDGETSRDFRPGDVRHSLADISRARQLIGYAPQFSVTQGLDIAAARYILLNMKILFFLPRKSSS